MVPAFVLSAGQPPCWAACAFSAERVLSDPRCTSDATAGVRALGVAGLPGFEYSDQSGVVRCARRGDGGFERFLIVVDRKPENGALNPALSSTIGEITFTDP